MIVKNVPSIHFLNLRGVLILLSIEKISNIENLRGLEISWNKTLKTANSNTLFLSFEWIYHWWKSFGRDKELLILIVKDNNDVIGIAPMMIEEYKIGKLTFKQISFIQNAHCYHLDFIITKKADEVIEVIFQYLKKEVKNWRRIYLNRIPISSNNITIIRDTCKKEYLFKEQYGGVAPYIPANGKWEEYYTKRKRKFRKELRRDWRLLSKQGKVEFKTYKKGSNMNLAIENLLEISKTTWKAKEGTAISSTPELTQFYTGIIKTAFEKGELVLVVMYFNDKPSGFLLCVIYNGILYELKMGYDPQVSTNSIGYFVENYLLEYSFNELQVKRVDLLGCEFTHFKRRYTDVGQEFTTFIIYKRVFLNYVYIILRSQLKKSNLFNKTRDFVKNIKK